MKAVHGQLRRMIGIFVVLHLKFYFLFYFLFFSLYSSYIEDEYNSPPIVMVFLGRLKMLKLHRTVIVVKSNDAAALTCFSLPPVDTVMTKAETICLTYTLKAL